MPKRKRASYARAELDPAQRLTAKKQDVETIIVHGKKLLNRALKTAKGFERQKLGKRISRATENNERAELVRLQRELEALKIIDISNAAEAHLYKTILKSKSISESKLLPDDLKPDNKKTDGSPEEVLAFSNVTARMYNTKPVKEAITHTMDSIYGVLGVSESTSTVKTAASENGVSHVSQGNAKDNSVFEDEVSENEDKIPQRKASRQVENVEGPLWEGFDTENESDSRSEDFSRYDSLVGGSSDESDEAVSRADQIRPPSHEKIINRPSDPSFSDSQSSQSPSPPLKPKKSIKKSQQAPAKPGSTFLPTLMGGYWSGSEESPTDDEQVAPPPRKNRRGQQERRAIWERKYGVTAKHLIGQVPSNGRDKDWDPRRGARGKDDRKDARRGGRINGFSALKKHSTGENAVPIKPRPSGKGKKDDAGPLHPSWEAAKKAKEMKKTAVFEGKKVVFD